jgi:hypothetical protein
MELTCPNAQAFSNWLASLTPEEALRLTSESSIENHRELLAEAGVDLDQCNKVQLLAVIRQRWAALSDDDLAMIVGGEKLVGKIVAAATIPVVAGVVAGGVVGVAAGAAGGLGYAGGTGQL